MLRRPSILVLALVLGCSPAQEAAVSASRPDPASPHRHAALDEILRRHVRDDRVDYLSVRKHDWDALVGYLARMAAVDVDALPRAERLALYLNVYNATMIKAVVERFRADYSPAEREFAVFDEELVRLGGRPLSLNHLEHEIIRKQFDEPRIHTALVCGARSCPPLLPRAYRAADLDAVLDSNMRRFVRDGERNRIDHDARRMQLSQILNWFKEDFGGEAGVPGYVARYAEGGERVAGYRVEFLEYSWQLNVAPPREGRWVEVPGGRVFEVIGERGDRLELARPFGATPTTVRAADTRPYSG